MGKITLDYTNTSIMINEQEISAVKETVMAAKETLTAGNGAGSSFTGWVDLPVNYDREEFARIQEAAARIRRQSDILFVIGIGGSYLGARAAIEFLRHSFANELPENLRKGPQIFFLGNSISSAYLKHLIDVIGDRNFSVNVISKSGTTTEPAIAFRIFKKLLIERYGKEEARKRIYATTDRKKGALKTMADQEGYETFVVPDDIGGRYSVLTAVGLLPIAAAGIDIVEMMEGAAEMRSFCLETPFEENDVLKYVAVRNLLYRKGRGIEILCNYEPSLHYVSEWWKQLYGESEGKDGKGIFPASVDLTTDLHSMGQFIQDGSKNHFETVLCVDESAQKVVIEAEENDLDGLNYLAGQTMDFVNKSAMNGTVMAHVEGGVPNMMIHLPDVSAKTLGQLFYFLEFGCGVSGYVLGVNPFDQPGVEAYKRNMFALLGKPGYEEDRARLLNNLPR